MRACKICTEKYLERHMDIFIENRYNKNRLINIATEYLRNINKPKSSGQNNTKNTRNIIKIPRVPILGPKFGKEFENKDIKIVFMLKAKLKSVLCQNKSNDSYPGVYLLNCTFNAEYIDQTKKVLTRTIEHQQQNIKGKWEG